MLLQIDDNFKAQGWREAPAAPFDTETKMILVTNTKVAALVKHFTQE